MIKLEKAHQEYTEVLTQKEMIEGIQRKLETDMEEYKSKVEKEDTAIRHILGQKVDIIEKLQAIGVDVQYILSQDDPNQNRTTQQVVDENIVLEAKVKELSEKVSNTEQDVGELQHEMDTVLEQVDSLTHKIFVREKQIQALDVEYNQILNAEEDTKTQTQIIEKSRYQLENVVDELRSKHEEIENDRKIVYQQLKTLADYLLLQQPNSQPDSKIEERTRMLKLFLPPSQDEEITELRAVIGRINAQLQNEIESRKMLSKQLEDIQSKIKR
eukprot:TRINITY_DN3456_c0_g1_i2.p1 TRINITY_DN3456_c0_g1~~TRINITY_DN3456_c0_g1_i2.p1  ORF type:complete len:271 (+),score=76.60 TRINITY_DN3456_c0_g1_i2:95-907(+)